MGVPVTVAMLFENNVSRLYDLFCAVLRCAAHKHDKEIGMSLTQKQKTKTKRKKWKNNNEYNKKKHASAIDRAKKLLWRYFPILVY